MSKLRFNDGVEIDTSGEYRRLQLADGLYVVGEGMLIAVEDEADCVETLILCHQRMLGHYSSAALPSDPLFRQSRMERIAYHENEIAKLKGGGAGL